MWRWPFTVTKPNLMESYTWTDAASVELFSAYSPPELRHLSFLGTNFCITETADVGRTGISRDIRKDGNHWARGPDYRVDDQTPPRRNPLSCRCLSFYQFLSVWKRLYFPKRRNFFYLRNWPCHMKGAICVRGALSGLVKKKKTTSTEK